jgi:hypothetical protein
LSESIPNLASSVSDRTRNRLLDIAALTTSRTAIWTHEIIRRFERTMAAEETPTTLYDRPMGELTGRAFVETSGCEILKFDHVEQESDLYEIWTVRFPTSMSPGGMLTLTLTKKNGEYHGKQITYHRDWDFVECANQVIAQHVHYASFDE